MNLSIDSTYVAQVNQMRTVIDEELPLRWERLEKVMIENQLDAVVIAGNSAVGPKSYGFYRYFTNHKIFYYLQALVARPQKPIMAACGSILHKNYLAAKGFQDIRLGEDIAGHILNTLSEQPVSKVGVMFEMLPASWAARLRANFPDVEFVDVTEELFELRQTRSAAEVEATRISAKIADIAYEKMCEVIKPGMKMSELHSILDYSLKKAGAEETFTLASNGKFSSQNRGLPCLMKFTWPDDRVIEKGDSVAVEITPRYAGYWAQLVRTVNVGKGNPELEELHRAQRKIIEAVVPKLKPGVPLEDVLKFMWEYSENLGYIPSLPFGHIVGLDLDEAGRDSLKSKLILQENMTFILHPTIRTPELDFGIFWGETYLVTNEGGEKLSSASDDLLTL